MTIDAAKGATNMKRLILFVIFSSVAAHAQSTVMLTPMPKPNALEPVAAASMAPPVIANPSATPHTADLLGLSFAVFAERQHIVENCKGVFSPCKEAIKDAQAGKVVRFSVGGYGIVFERGSIVLIDTTVHDFSAFVAEATGIYGAPTESTTVTLANALGAHFDVGHARWSLPNGGVLSADETISTSYGITRYTEVSIRTSEKQRQLDAITAQRPVL